MMSFQTFDQWHSVAGFATVAFFCLLYPVLGEKPPLFKTLFFLGVFLAIVLPFGVITDKKEYDKLLMRSGKMVHCFEFILLFYCYLQRETLQKHIPYFFWFCYGLACYSLLELLFVDVLLSSKFQFVNVLFPWLNTHFGVVDFNFTAFINYLIKFVFIALFLRDSFKSPTLKQTFQYLMWALVVFEVVQVVVFKSYQGYDSLSSTVKNFFILGGAGLLLYYIYRAPEVTLPLQKNTYFWICLGLFLPALTEFFLEFIFSKLYQTDAVSFYKYYLLRNASQMVGFTLLIVGVWQAKYLKYLLKEF